MVTIYALICHVNGKGYVGSTKAKLAKRFREHRCLLNGGNHQCAELLVDWREYGSGMFGIELLEDGAWESPQRREAELRWMDFYAEKGLLYNEHRISMQPDEAAWIKGVANAHLRPGKRWTEEANEKRRQAQLGIPKGHGAKISATKRARRKQVMI